MIVAEAAAAELTTEPLVWPSTPTEPKSARHKQAVFGATANAVVLVAAAFPARSAETMQCR